MSFSSIPASDTPAEVPTWVGMLPPPLLPPTHRLAPAGERGTDRVLPRVPSSSEPESGISMRPEVPASADPPRLIDAGVRCTEGSRPRSEPTLNGGADMAILPGCCVLATAVEGILMRVAEDILMNEPEAPASSLLPGCMTAAAGPIFVSEELVDMGFPNDCAVFVRRMVACSLALPQPPDVLSWRFWAAAREALRLSVRLRYSWSSTGSRSTTTVTWWGTASPQHRCDGHETAPRKRGGLSGGVSSPLLSPPLPSSPPPVLTTPWLPSLLSHTRVPSGLNSEKPATSSPVCSGTQPRTAMFRPAVEACRAALMRPEASASALPYRKAPSS